MSSLAPSSLAAFAAQACEITGAENVITSDLDTYAVDDVTPGVAVRPLDEAQVAATLLAAATHSLAVIPLGGREHIGCCNVPARYDVALLTERMSRVVAHEPADMTITVDAGARLTDVQSMLAEHGQHLPLDPIGDRATVGGIIAASAFGPLRHAHGTVRDWLIGIRVAHPDGSVSKAGGRVVKNVTGYEMTKLYAGSFGTLAVVTEATFKLAPVPPLSSTIALACDSPHEGARVALAARDAGLSVRRCELLSPAAARRVVGSARWHLLCEIAGVSAAVGRSLRELRSLVGGSGEERPQEVWTHWRHAFTPAYFSLRLHLMPSRVSDAIERLATELDENPTSISSTVVAGVVRLNMLGENAPTERIVVAARSLAAAAGGHAVVEAAPSDLKQHIDVLGEARGDLPIMRRLKEQLDPTNVLSPGRFLGRL
jgi:glycolate oxidase FAD binding subunit